MRRSPECEIHPVILKVPPEYLELPVRERVRFLSRYARRAVSESAARAGFRLTSFPKNENGAPLALDGVYWSLTHKPAYVAGVAAPGPIGIDIEEIRSRSERLKDRIAGPEEWDLVDAEQPESFFRYWTAKEAVLKAAGVGLAALSGCRILKIMDTHHLVVDFQGQNWTVAHHFFDGHLASVVRDGYSLRWGILNGIEPDFGFREF
ncbi:MAG: 4'-phosphopantetheinyl transferase family protein [Thermodesulfobacteriota bacterium]